MSKDLTIQDFAKLRSPHVRMKDEAAVLRAINEIARGGANKLQVVTDFDRTVTKQHVNGSPVKSSFGIFEQSPMLPDKFKQDSKRYFNKYRPIEIDTTISMNQKERAMEEWMDVTQQILTGLTVPKKEIRRLAKDYGSDIRDHTKEMFKLLNKEGVPVLVFSAGLGDIVEAILYEHDIYLENTKVFSNFLKYEGDQILGFKNKILLHVFNKKEHAVEDDEYFKYLKGRSTALLMGDTTGDADMTEGVESIDTVLKIGFLYEDMEKNLPIFMEKFDIVLIDDQTMDVPLEILRKTSVV